MAYERLLKRLLISQERIQKLPGRFQAGLASLPEIGHYHLGKNYGDYKQTRPYTRHMSLLVTCVTKSVTDGPTDRRIDGRTHALIESLHRD